MQKLFKAHARVHPDLLWRICDIQSYAPEMIDHPLKKTFLPEGLGWDPENEWELEEAEEIGADVARGVSDPAKLPRRGMF